MPGLIGADAATRSADFHIATFVHDALALASR